MRLLTVDEVTERWKCRRITVLRLMKNHALGWFEAADGEPLFDESEILKIKNPHTAKPLLRLVEQSPGPKVMASTPEFRADDLSARLGRVNEESRKLKGEAAALRANSVRLIERTLLITEKIIEQRQVSWRARSDARALRRGKISPRPARGKVMKFTKQTQKIEENQGSFDFGPPSTTNNDAG